MIDEVEHRASEGFSRLEDVIAAVEPEAILTSYLQAPEGRSTNPAPPDEPGQSLTPAGPPAARAWRLVRNAAGEKPVNWWKSRIKWA